MSRPKINISKSINLPLLGDMPERISAVQAEGETRVAFIRRAINMEIARREYKRREAEHNRTVTSHPSSQERNI